MLESGLSADVVLRERKGRWLVRDCSLMGGGCFQRVLVMALCDGVSPRGQSCLVMETAM